MPWEAELSHEAARQLGRLPPKHRDLIAKSIDAMERDPFAGDVRALQGEEWNGAYRKRTGRYRIIFTANHESRVVGIAAILLRKEETYR